MEGICLHVHFHSSVCHTVAACQYGNLADLTIYGHLTGVDWKGLEMEFSIVCHEMGAFGSFVSLEDETCFHVSFHGVGQSTFGV